MSLTLNVCKEAKLFYKSEQKSRECLEERMIHPSSTIHMKKYSPVRSSPTPRSANNRLFENSDESSDECSVDGVDQGRDWTAQAGKIEASVIKRRRLQQQRENSKLIPTSSGVPHQPSFKYNHHLHAKADSPNQSLRLKQAGQRNRAEKREYMEKRKQDQKEGSQQQEIKKYSGPQRCV